MSARIYKRGRVWWTWYYDTDGARHDESTRCRDKRAATRFARQRERTAAAPAHATTTLAQAAEHFRLDRVVRGCSDATIAYYDAKIGHMLRLLGNDTLLATIDASAVDAMVAQRILEGASRSTAGKEFRALGSILRLMRRRGQWSGDVAAVLPEGWETSGKRGGPTHTPEQARAFVDALPAHRAGHVAYLFVSAARLGPSLVAERDDLDLDRGLVRVRGTKTRAAARIVPVFAHVADLAARARLAARPTGPAYRPWANIRRDMAAACRRAKVPEIGPNGCRRSAATWLVEMGAPTGIVSFYLGHTTSRLVEQVYGRLDGDALGRGFESVGIKVTG